MAHEIMENDTLFVSRTPAWHGLGTLVPDALCSADALKMSGLDWEVIQQPVYAGDDTVDFLDVGTTQYASGQFQRVDDWVINRRSDDGTVLGVVGKGYKVVQNVPAFAWTDSLLGEGVKYESAGSLRGGRRVWILASLPPTRILGDKIDPYLLFSNGHDGRSAVRCCITPVRVECMNTLNCALAGADRSWSTAHQGDMNAKLAEAQRTLELAGEYMDKLDEAANRLADIQVTSEFLAEITVDLFPLNKDPKRHALTYEMRKEFLYRYNAAPDLSRFRGTGWGVVNAVSDFAGHRQPKRRSASFEGTRMEKIVNGHALVDKAVELLLAA